MFRKIETFGYNLALEKRNQGVCDVFLPGLNHLCYWYDKQKTPLRDKARLRNDPQWVPDFLSYCSWMFLEQVWNKSKLVDLEENHRVWTRHPKCSTPSG